MKKPERNYLYPVFLKLHELDVLIVGGGNVALEKIHFILKSSPRARISVVAPDIREEVYQLVLDYPDAKVTFLNKPFVRADLDGHDVVIAATSIRQVNLEVHRAAKAKGILINVADTPELCDFYMGAIVTKGNIKLGISTNGSSPTLAKRLREYFEETLPDEIDDLANNLNKYRKLIAKSKFADKVRQLNTLTEKLIQ